MLSDRTWVNIIHEGEETYDYHTCPDTTRSLPALYWQIHLPIKPDSLSCHDLQTDIKGNNSVRHRDFHLKRKQEQSDMKTQYIDYYSIFWQGSLHLQEEC